MRVIQYRQGQIHGELREWDINGQEVTRVEYQDGRRLEKTTETYPDGQKKVEGTVLQARLVIKQPDDWWMRNLPRTCVRAKTKSMASGPLGMKTVK